MTERAISPVITRIAPTDEPEKLKRKGLGSIKNIDQVSSQYVSHARTERGDEFSVVVELLRQVLVEQRTSNERLASIERRLQRRPSPDDHAVLVALLPAIRGTYGDRVFTTHQILQKPSLKALAGGLNCKQLGKLFARNVQVPINGLCVDRSGLESNAQLWFLTLA